MITLYRCVRSPEETRLTFQATEDDLFTLKQILHFEPKASTRPNLYEKGYYAYLRGQWRDKTEQEALTYLAARFSAPTINLLLFESNKQLPADRPFYEWASSLEWMIHNHFAGQGFIATQGGLGHEIYRKQPHEVCTDLQVFEGATYRVQVTPTYVSQLQVDICYRLEYKGKYIRERDLPVHITDGLADALTCLKDFSTRDTDTIFKLARRFVKSILILPVADGLQFDSQPSTAESLSLDTWLWEHHAPVRIEVGNQAIVPLAQQISEYHYGLYKPPTESLTVVIMHPSQDAYKWCRFQNWAIVCKLVQQNLAAMLGEEHCVQVLMQEYPVSGETGEVVAACEAKLDASKDHVPLFLIIAPPENSRGSTDVDLVALDNFTYRMGQQLRRLRRGAYTSSVGWNKLENSYDRPYVIENALLKSIIVMGAVPWRIVDIAHSTDEQTEDICFIGVDVNCFKRVPTVGGVIFDSHGVLQGYHLVAIAEPKGEQIDAPSFRTLIDKLLKHYRNATGRQPRHIIIHRDGLVNAEQEVIAEYSTRLGIDIDLVEVRKSGNPRLQQDGNTSGTPSKDIAVGSEQLGRAYLVNTLTVGEQLTTGRYIFPAPESIGIYRVAGTTPMKILAAQVHALTYANYSSYRRTEKLPITITYADSLVNNASLKPEQDSFGKPVNAETRVYWL